MPIVPTFSLGVVVYLIVLHTIVGVPLALWYRRSGNLLVPAVAHAFIDAVRDALIGSPV